MSIALRKKEKDIRTRIVDMVKAIPAVTHAAIPAVYDHAIPPIPSLMSKYKELVVDVQGDINVAFVSLAFWDGDINDVRNPQPKGADILTYEIRRIRGLVDDKFAADGETLIVSANIFYEEVEQLILKFDQDIEDTGDGTLGGLGNGISHNSLRTVQAIQPWTKLSGYDIYMAVLALDVMNAPC